MSLPLSCTTYPLAKQRYTSGQELVKGLSYHLAKVRLKNWPGRDKGLGHSKKNNNILKFAFS